MPCTIQLCCFQAMELWLPDESRRISFTSFAALARFAGLLDLMLDFVLTQLIQSKLFGVGSNRHVGWP